MLCAVSDCIVAPADAGDGLGARESVKSNEVADEAVQNHAI